MQQILNFLNLGGSVEALDDALNAEDDGSSYWLFVGSAQTIEDLTGDGISEVLLDIRHASNETLYILACAAGLYKAVYEEVWQIGDFRISGYSIQDINGNGINELITDVSGGHGAYHWKAKVIYEWNGQTLKKVLDTPGMNVQVSVQLSDLDDNGSKELIVTLGPPFECVVDPPWWFPTRNEIFTYAWNGIAYIEIGHEFAPPEYRFQAVHAGDAAYQEGDYQAALAFYQQAIFDDTLKWGSKELWQYRQDSCNRMGDDTPPPPDPNPNERPNLSAYSRYRIILLHVMTNEIRSAKVTYDTLQTMFPMDQVGHPYAELAEVFWSEYERSGSIGEACMRAINFASENEEAILGPLGVDTYGFISDVWYEPQDICPVGE